MKPLAVPYVPGNTDAERMDNAVRRMFSVSKRGSPEARGRMAARAGSQQTGQKIQWKRLRVRCVMPENMDYGFWECPDGRTAVSRSNTLPSPVEGYLFIEATRRLTD